VAIGRYARGDTRLRVTTSVPKLHREFRETAQYVEGPFERGAWTQGSLTRVVDRTPNFRPANQHGRIPSHLSEAMAILVLSDSMEHLSLAVNQSGLEPASE
jgi:hypothetical protein